MSLASENGKANAGSAASTLRSALAWPVARRSLLLALVVGTALNLINQGDVIWSQAPIVWWKVALTYCVPFCVATYGAYCGLRAGDM